MDFDPRLRAQLPPELLQEISAHSEIEYFPKGTEILREEQYVKVLPIVIDGLVKVYSRFEERELLLYYIEPAQSCVMSFYAALRNTPSRIYAVTEEDSKLWLLPVHQVPGWLKQYPQFNELFYHQFNLRYSELLDTISHLLLDRLDKRLYDHLQRKAAVLHTRSFKISHGQLANELGTAREVISRVMKKLETDGLVLQNSGEITLISME